MYFKRDYRKHLVSCFTQAVLPSTVFSAVSTSSWVLFFFFFSFQVYLFRLICSNMILTHKHKMYYLLCCIKSVSLV